MYSYLLAGENLGLAEAELKGFLKSQDIEEIPETDSRLALTEAEPSQLKRLALIHEVGEVLEQNVLNEIDYNPRRSFRLRVENYSEKERDIEALETKLGGLMSSENNEVDLENPEEILKIYVTDKSSYLVKLVEDIDRGLFQKRVNHERPFSSPVSLDPVLARVLVNLAEIKAGEHLLDPFCGTGGILIEAGLCGVGVHGLDIDEEMVEGTRQNLEEYGIINHDIRQGDISEYGEIFDMDFDGVVTDLPYGRASRKSKDAVEGFVENIVEKDCKVIFMSDRENLQGLEHEFEVYQHKNLTRYIYIV